MKANVRNAITLPSDEASTIISSQFRHLSLHRVRQNSEK